MEEVCQGRRVHLGCSWATVDGHMAGHWELAPESDTGQGLNLVGWVYMYPQAGECRDKLADSGCLQDTEKME